MAYIAVTQVALLAAPKAVHNRNLRYRLSRQPSSTPGAWCPRFASCLWTPTWDHCARLSGWCRVSTTGLTCWGHWYVIDDWGSLYQKNVTYGTGESYLQTVNNNMNRFDGPGYDAAGNLLSSGSFYNIFNSENQWTYVSATNSSYLYDGDGNKVQTSGGASGTTIFWRDQKGQVLSETDQTGSVNNNYIYLNRQAVAWIDIGHGVPTAYRYYIHDHLGTTRVMTTSTGSVCYDADFFPWGGEQHLFTNTCSQSYKFTGKERDPDTAADYFGARWYQNAPGTV